MADSRDPRSSPQPQLQTQSAAAQGRTSRSRPPPPRAQIESVTDAIRDLSEGLGTLLRGHLQLARVELKHEARSMARDFGLELSGAPLLLFGYFMLWIAGSLGLGLVMPLWAAFLIAAGVNLLAGALLVTLGARRMRREKAKMPATADEWRKDRALASELRESQGAPPEELH